MNIGTSKLKNELRKKTKPMRLKVCMMGPKAVGKTSILTAIFSDAEINLGAETNLQFRPIGATADDLADRKLMFSSIFHDQIKITDEPAAGQYASSDVATFDFVFGLKGASGTDLINMEIKDFPGEYLKSRPEDVTDFIKESTAVFIALDTPHLMEHDGRYNEVRNQISKITQYFKNANVAEERLVLIVPLKCERYFYEKRMPEVLQKVKEAYKELIDHLSTSLICCCAVTPILTLGGVEYAYTEGGDAGQILLDAESGLPKKLHYRFRNPAKYKPLFCVQPLYYMLSFMTVQYERSIKNSSWWNRLLNFILADNEKLREEIYAIEKYRCVSSDSGYSILSGGNLLTHH